VIDIEVIQKPMLLNGFFNLISVYFFQ